MNRTECKARCLCVPILRIGRGRRVTNLIGSKKKMIKSYIKWKMAITCHEKILDQLCANYLGLSML